MKPEIKNQIIVHVGAPFLWIIRENNTGSALNMEPEQESVIVQ
jgi:hypothetical protein